MVYKLVHAVSAATERFLLWQGAWEGEPMRMMPESEYLTVPLLFTSGDAALPALNRWFPKGYAMRIGVWLLVSLFSAGACLAQITIHTQPTVAAIIPDTFRVHVFTKHVDFDFNDVQDEGDLPGQWLILDRFTLDTVSSVNFPWASGGVVGGSRVAVDFNTGLLFAGIGDSVYTYALNTQQRSATAIYAPNASALTYDERTPYLYITTRPTYTEPGTLIIVNLETLERTEIEVGVNPIQVMVRQEQPGVFSAAVLCEGLYGKADGGITWVSATGATTNTLLGDTPAYMVALGDDLLVSMNGAHSILQVDGTTHTLVPDAEIATPTSGYDGPREMAIGENLLFVTTYKGTLLVYSMPDGSFVKEVDLPAKADPVAIFDNKVWVGLTLDKVTYEPRGNVVVFTIPEVTSVAEGAGLPVAGSIATSAATVRLPFIGNAPVEVFGIHGTQLPVSMIDESSHTIRISDLPAGTYVVLSGEQVVVLLKY